MSIRILQIRDHSISVDQEMYATYVLENYLETDTIKENSKFHRNTVPHNMIFIKKYDSTRNEKAEILYRAYNIQYINVLGQIIYLFIYKS